MRRTPLLLAIFGALVAVLAVSSSALAAGKAVGHTSHASTAAKPAAKSSAHSQAYRGATTTPPRTTPAGAAQDTPSGNDPSFKSSTGTETVDHGKGNDCDPGNGGSNPKGNGPDHGNDLRNDNGGH